MKVPLAVGAGAIFLKVLAATYRFTYRNREAFERLASEGGVVLPFWHNRLIGGLTAPVFRKHDTVTIISQHKDGEIIARIQQKFGHRSIRGSSKRGGTEALFEMEKNIRAGAVVGVTPDGPNGPRYVAKPGAAILVEKTGRPALPFLAAASRRWKFSSWDGFELPKPFANVVLLFGNPVAPTGDIETTRDRIEKEMRRMVVEGERIFGREPDL